MSIIRTDNTQANIEDRSSIRNGLAVILVAASLTACSGGSDSTAPDTSENTPPETPNNPTGKRVSRIQYDLDNNGVYEGTRTFSYDTDGRVVAENYTYTDDGTLDTDFGSFSIGAPNYNETTAYSYDATHLLTLWTVTDPTGRTEFSYDYGSDNLIDSNTLSFFNTAGALLNSLSFDLVYTSTQLTHWEARTSANGPAFQNDKLTYDASGRVQTDLLEVMGGTQTESTYQYSATGKILNIQRTNIQPPGSYHGNIDFEYDAQDRLTARISSTDEISDSYRWRYQYDSDGVQNEWLIDLLDDGSTEAAVRYEYETGPCTTVFIWAPRSEPNFVVSTAVPYAPGSGYAEIPVCISQTP